MQYQIHQTGPIFQTGELQKSSADRLELFIFLGLSLLTLVIVCVAEPNVEDLHTTKTTQTREGKSKFEMTLAIILIINMFLLFYLSVLPVFQVIKFPVS